MLKGERMTREVKRDPKAGEIDPLDTKFFLGLVIILIIFLIIAAYLLFRGYLI